MESRTTSTSIRRRLDPHRLAHQGEFRIKWSDGAVARLSDAVRPYPFIYDIDHPQHKDRVLRDNTWMTIAKDTGIIHDQRLIPAFSKECERKFRNLRDELVKVVRQVRSRKTNKPYRHYDKLSYLEDHINRQESGELIYFESGNIHVGDHNYGEHAAIDGANCQETEQATRHISDNGQVAVVSETWNYNREPNTTTSTSNTGSKRKTKPTKVADGGIRVDYSTPAYYEPHGQPTMVYVRPQKREKEKYTDELEDFAQILGKRLRRLPSDRWGQVMSRMMDTLSAVEESTKKVETETVASQTDD